MTHQQQKLLRFIERYQAEHDGVSPSFVEMAAELGLASKANIHRIVSALEQQGKVRRGPGRIRTLEVVGLPGSLAALSDEALLAEVARRGLLQVAA